MTQSSKFPALRGNPICFGLSRGRAPSRGTRATALCGDLGERLKEFLVCAPKTVGRLFGQFDPERTDVARPMPLAAPVTTAIRPSSLPMTISLSRSSGITRHPKAQTRPPEPPAGSAPEGVTSRAPGRASPISQHRLCVSAPFAERRDFAWPLALACSAQLGARKIHVEGV